eukprot:TRINITY_DN5844_c0_g5_i1.p2 TRINITY_DN5844_c0_g5~~TRINITY_DN5844_c0_g5_i1.p2  ORF type:complete len:137 (+),score=25.55 TRINITY_DN5844_c0_g5_i1:809-1219(+)
MYLREKAKNPNKKIDILSMKGKHKSKLIQKVKNDSESSEAQPGQNNTAESKSTWQKIKELFGCSSDSSGTSEEQRMELPRTIIDPNVSIGREIEFAQDRWMRCCEGSVVAAGRNRVQAVRRKPCKPKACRERAKRR